MQVYQTNADGLFAGITEADPSPLEDGVWLIPGGCVTVEPPDFGKGHQARWIAGEERWEIEPVPAPAEPEETPAYTPVFLMKKTLWARMTDDEADAVDAALSAAPRRMIRMYEAENFLDTGSTEYAAFHGLLLSALAGDEDRVAVLTAPDR